MSAGGVMQAAVAAEGKVAIRSVQRPQAGRGQVLIEIHHFGINRADTLQRKGLYPVPKGESNILGLECSGIVAEDSKTGSFKKGERVMALLSAGGYAEYVAADEGCTMHIPNALCLKSAAAIPEQWLTAFQLLQIGNIRSGQYVLIHAGGSGVGTALVQLVAHLGAFPIVTAGSKEKIDRAISLGAVFGANYKEKSGFFPPISEFLTKYARNTGSSENVGVDLILDPVGASHSSQNFQLIKRDGTWVLYGLMGGAQVKDYPLVQILMKRITLTGSTLRSRTYQYKRALVDKFSREILPHFAVGGNEGGKLQVVVNREFNFSDVNESHTYMEQNKNFGKILVKVKTEEKKSK